MLTFSYSSPSIRKHGQVLSGIPERDGKQSSCWKMRVQNTNIQLGLATWMHAHQIGSSISDKISISMFKHRK